MRIRFVGQPFAAHQNLLDFVEHVKNGGFEELEIAVAWAKQSGLGRIWDALAEFRARGGKVTLVVGVSEGGATKEGLRIALDIADRAYVFHDPGRTFHPKVYLASSSGARSLMVGSSNLTAGGLGWNYEASLWVDWDAGEGEDVTDSVGAWFESLISEKDSCAPLTADLIEKLEKSTDIVLGSESRARRFQKSRSDTPEDNDSTIAATISGLFKAVRAGLRKLPKQNAKYSAVPTTAAKSASTRTPTAVPSGVQQPVLGTDHALPDDNIQRRWVKELDNTAAQQVKSQHSNPTGNLRLSMESMPVDHKRYFRESLFGGLPWTPTDGKDSEQEVVVGFHVWIDGNDLGVLDLRLSHDPRRVSGQGNVPTVLHWGVLSPVLKATTYIGQYVSIERTDVGEFNLVISRAPRGDYIV